MSLPLAILMIWEDQTHRVLATSPFVIPLYLTILWLLHKFIILCITRFCTEDTLRSIVFRTVSDWMYLHEVRSISRVRFQPANLHRTRDFNLRRNVLGIGKPNLDRLSTGLALQGARASRPPTSKHVVTRTDRTVLSVIGNTLRHGKKSKEKHFKCP